MLWVGTLCAMTGRFAEALAFGQRVRKLSDTPFYVTGSYVMRMYVDLKRGETAAIGATAREAEAAGATPGHLEPFTAMAAAIEGRIEDARRLVSGFEQNTNLGFGSLLTAASVALRVGEVAVATRLMQRPLAQQLAPATIRMDVDLLALADETAFAPRRMDAALVWPLEAPMIDAARFRLFREVKIESGLPER
jgi:hypothetical protein